MATTPMIGPDGSIADVPNDQVNHALKLGAKVGADVVSPDGSQRAVVPLDSVQTALSKGAKLVSPPQGSGVQINDVGNRVIVPADGESFSDTMRRAAEYGKTVTPEMVNAEERTIPGKAATVLGAAPAIGAALPATAAGGAAISYAAGPALGTAARLVGRHPLATAFAVHVARELGIPLPKVLDVLSTFKGQ